jgi:phosphate transport system permease protein
MDENKLTRSKKRKQNIAFFVLGLLGYSIIAILIIILSFIVMKGISSLSWEFISKMPEEGMTKGGIFPAIIGTLYLVAGSILFAFPIGVLAAIYMNEYVKDGFIKKFIKQMTNNLSGVPSIVFGLFGMALFVNKLGFGDSILAGSLTLGLLALPVVIRTTEEALKAVDDTFRQASLGLGATKWQTTRRVVLPIAFPNIITGLILSVGRVSGETAPILFTVAAYFLPKLPSSIFDQAMALPYHLYVISTSGTNVEESRPIAYGTALVLILIVLITNLLANGLRRYFGKKVKMN